MDFLAVAPSLLLFEHLSVHLCLPLSVKQQGSNMGVLILHVMDAVTQQTFLSVPILNTQEKGQWAAARGKRYCSKKHDCCKPHVGWGRQERRTMQWFPESRPGRNGNACIILHLTGEETGPQTGQVYHIIQGFSQQNGYLTCDYLIPSMFSLCCPNVSHSLEHTPEMVFEMIWGIT